MKHLILFACLLLCVQAQAQFYPVPIESCCSQAITLTRQLQETATRLQATQTLLDSTRAVSGRIIASVDERLATAIETANTRLASLESERAAYLSALKSEGLRGRLFGLGRRGWIRRQVKALEN